MIYFIHRIFKLDGIARRLFFWVIIVVLLTSFLHFLSFLTIGKGNRIAEAEANLKYGLQNQKVILENWAADRAREIRLLANLPAVKERKLDTIANIFTYHHQYYDQLNSLVFIDKEGYVKIDSAHKDVIIANSDVSLKERDYFIAAEQGKEYLYDVKVSKVTGQPVIIFSAPVLSEQNEFLGVVFGAVHLSQLNEMLRKSIQGGSGEVTLINQEGMVISHVAKNCEDNFALSTKLETKIIEYIDTGNRVLDPYVNEHGDEVFGQFTPIFDGRYVLINEINKKEVFQSLYEMVLVKIVLTIAIGIIIFIVVAPVSRNLVRPFISLVKAIKRMKSGKYYTQLELDEFQTTPTEIKQIMQMFNEMAMSIKENQKKLQELSSTDGLTGIANRRAIEEYLDKEWRQAKREQSSLSVAFIDIDFFKQFNDTFGHLEGDACLIKIASAIKQTVRRPRDFTGRYGGEEFILILPDTNQEQATIVAERVRKQVEELRIPRTMGDVDKFVTVSIGVATLIPSNETEKEKLIQLADDALYEAKTSGRNKLVTYEEKR